MQDGHESDNEHTIDLLESYCLKHGLVCNLKYEEDEIQYPDDFWGIGLEESSPDAIRPRNRRGENLLGFALMKVRDMVKSKTL